MHRADKDPRSNGIRIYAESQKRTEALPVPLLDGLDDVLIGPVPVGALTVAHHLPHHDPEAPGVLHENVSKGRPELSIM